jgi:hypothetical protein
MDERKTDAPLSVIAAIEAFWGEPTKQGPVKSIITRCAPALGEAGAQPFLDHEREDFDELYRLVERLRYDDEGRPYRRERIVYPAVEPDSGSIADRLIRHFIEPYHGYPPSEWRYLPDGLRIWASRFEADGNEAAIWSYALDAAGRIVECVQEDGHGRFLCKDSASYDSSGRLIELVSLDIDAPEVRHLFEYGQGYRKLSWDGRTTNYVRVSL